MFIICFVLIGLAVFTIPIISIYVLIMYIFTGKENEDLIFIAVDRVMNIDINFIDDLW
jgi:hypothetical protein